MKQETKKKICILILVPIAFVYGFEMGKYSCPVYKAKMELLWDKSKKEVKERNVEVVMPTYEEFQAEQERQRQ